jgi:hypothetical protein
MINRYKIGLVYGGILLWTFGPFLTAGFAELIANINGCTLNEGTVNTCMVFGRDIGNLLYSMFVTGWYILLTFPSGALLFLMFSILLIVLQIQKQRNRS